MSKKGLNNNEDILSLVYKLNDSTLYDVDENGIVFIKIPQNHFIQRFFRKIKVKKIPEFRKIELDQFGSFVFRQIDGKKTVEEIGELLDQEFGEEAHPIYERLLLFLNHIEINEKYIERLGQ
ncbi:MAG: PqqD family protein [Erysipelotrichales bacterium]